MSLLFSYASRGPPETKSSLNGLLLSKHSRISWKVPLHWQTTAPVLGDISCLLRPGPSSIVIESCFKRSGALDIIYVIKVLIFECPNLAGGRG